MAFFFSSFSSDKYEWCNDQNKFIKLDLFKKFKPCRPKDVTFRILSSDRTIESYLLTEI